jgi:serine phosphatase RsbU (regulator of sigma subunit)
VSQAQITELNGYFPVNNYTNDDFHSPVQIWTGAQTSQGIFVFGNDKKIISFNGSDWSFIDLDTSRLNISEKSIDEKKVYKLFTSSDSTIYVARENSLGTLEYNDRGALTYVPFYFDSTLANVWYIHELKDHSILFTASDRILAYQPGLDSVKTMLSNEQVNNGFINSSVAFDNKLIIGVSFEKKDNNRKGQFFIIDFKNQGSIQPVSIEEKTASYQFRSSYSTIDTNFFVNYQGVVFYLDRKSNTLKERFKLRRNGKDSEVRVNTLIKHENHLWVATANHGVEIYDLHGKIIREFGEVEELQDLNVFSLFFDKDDNLWLNLDNGIANIEFSSPTATWDRKQGLEGAAEALIVENNDILIATRSGIFSSYAASNRMLFKNTRVTEESCFDIKKFQTEFGERILIVGYNNVYEITSLSEKAKPIGRNVYGWELFQSPFKPNEVYIGGEGFLGKFTLNKNGWNFKEVKSFPGTTIRKFEYFQGKIYFSVSDKGVYEIDEEEKIDKLLLSNDVNTDDSHFFLESFKGSLYAGYTFGLLQIKGDSLVKINAKGINFDDTEMIIHRLYKHPEKEELWAVIFDETDKDRSKEEVGYFSLEGEDLRWQSLNNNSLESGVAMDILYHNNLLYFATNEGLLVFDRQKLQKIKNPWNVYISSISVNDSTVIHIPEHARPLGAIPYGKSIRFNFAGNSFSNNGKILYRKRILELSKVWSKYEPNNFKNLDNLPHGTYTLEVQGKNYHNAESNVYKYTFTILPPWYFTWWAYIIYFVIFILIIIITTRISIYRVKQKNKQLEETVQERTKEIASQNTMLEDQKNQIAAKNEDILDSIKYAKRIQNTILPSESLLSNRFNDHFVFYRPKDIVSGDFYWMRKVGDKIIWSAIDCTGHGVPGALVSIVGNNSLVRTVNEFKLSQPNEVLDKLRELVVESFKAQGERDVKDGMDLALVSLDPKTKKLMYSGANNPLVVIRNKEIIEIKADKQPVGDFERAFPFTNHEVQLEDGDAIYVFTDGYVDQFGGPKGKKLKSKPFRELLISVSHLPMSEQLAALNAHFDDWKGELEQLDDVCVFGVRV